jgi:hypothetical protein
MNVTIQYTRGKEVITEPLENITRRGLKLKIARMKKKGFSYVILKCVLCLMLLLPLSCYSQTWDQYSRRAKISVGVLNVAFMAYSTSKQYFIPIETQKWLNWYVATPVIGFTFYTGFEYRKKFKSELLRNSKLNCSFDSTKNTTKNHTK